MHILSLTGMNSLPLKSKKNKTEKFSKNKIYFIFDFTYDVQFLLDLDNK